MPQQDNGAGQQLIEELAEVYKFPTQRVDMSVITDQLFYLTSVHTWNNHTLQIYAITILIKIKYIQNKANVSMKETKIQTIQFIYDIYSQQILT